MVSASDGAEPAPAPTDHRRQRLLALLADGATDSATDSATGSATESAIGAGRVESSEDDAALSPSSASSPSSSPASMSLRGVLGLRARLQRLCVITAREVGVDGAGITVMGSADAGLAGQRDQLAATGALARRLEDLQLTAGEGPCLDAFTSGAPVLAPDTTIETARWLGFAPEAVAAGAGAVFSLPLQVGAVRLGTLDLHRAAAGGLSRAQLADALTLATLATETLLELATLPGDETDEPDADREPGLDGGWLPDVHAEVHIASGMVSARLGVDVGTALLRIRGYAFARGEPIHDVARRLIDRELVFDDPDTHDLNATDDGPEGPDTSLEGDD